MKDILEEPLVLLDSSFFVYRMVHDLFAQENQKPQVVHYSPYLHTIKNLVRAGIGSTFLTRQAILQRDDLVVIPMETPFYINSGIVTKKGRQLYDDERLLIKYLKEITGNSTH